MVINTSLASQAEGLTPVILTVIICEKLKAFELVITDCVYHGIVEVLSACRVSNLIDLLSDVILKVGPV